MPCGMYLVCFCFQAAHNIGFAMDTPAGLLVPVIKNVNNLSIFEVAQHLNHLIEVGKAGKLGNEELSGGTFTLSNIGSVSLYILFMQNHIMNST